jgi:outer membrane protein OmpA-like peptidoglycan-associated protein
MPQKSRNSKTKTESNFSLSIGDLMAALLFIFVLLLAATLLRLQTEHDRRMLIAESYENIKESLYNDLKIEFKDDFLRWNVVFTGNDSLTIRFKEPDVLFATGESNLRQLFKVILNDFFPRYTIILMRPEYIDRIEEVRIEGHTSSEWRTQVSQEESYFYNMKLSQDRTRSVLEHCLSTFITKVEKTWAIEKITANGLSFSKSLKDSNGIEDRELSRRVEFRIKTNAEQELTKMLNLATEK